MKPFMDGFPLRYLPTMVVFIDLRGDEMKMWAPTPSRVPYRHIMVFVSATLPEASVLPVAVDCFPFFCWVKALFRCKGLCVKADGL